MTDPRAGFVGLGTMGRGMAANILKAGFELTVHNRTPWQGPAADRRGRHLRRTSVALATYPDPTLEE